MSINGFGQGFGNQFQSAPGFGATTYLHGPGMSTEYATHDGGFSLTNVANNMGQSPASQQAPVAYNSAPFDFSNSFQNPSQNLFQNTAPNLFQNTAQASPTFGAPFPYPGFLNSQPQLQPAPAPGFHQHHGPRSHHSRPHGRGSFPAMMSSILEMFKTMFGSFAGQNSVPEPTPETPEAEEATNVLQVTHSAHAGKEFEHHHFVDISEQPEIND